MIWGKLVGLSLDNGVQIATQVSQRVDTAPIGKDPSEFATFPSHQQNGLARTLDFAPPGPPFALFFYRLANGDDAFLVIEWDDYPSARADRTALASCVAAQCILGGRALERGQHANNERLVRVLQRLEYQILVARHLQTPAWGSQQPVPVDIQGRSLDAELVQAAH
jgi:hypothetical protein